MSQQFYGSICLSDILEQAKKQHSAFVKAENGKIYVNCNLWLNDEEDKFGNVMSMKLSATKEAIAKDETQGKIYIGNFKESESTSKPLGKKDTAALEGIADDLPF